LGVWVRWSVRQHFMLTMVSTYWHASPTQIPHTGLPTHWLTCLVNHREREHPTHWKSLQVRVHHYHTTP
jgi:hypothetical protein